MPATTDDVRNPFRPRLVLTTRIFACVSGLIGITGLFRYIFDLRLLITVNRKDGSFFGLLCALDPFPAK